MPRRCTQCTRINPSVADFCWFDGLPLDGSAVVPGEGTSINFGIWAFPSPFVFPSGTSCRNFLQLALACQRNPQEAADILQQGFFESFFSLIGRADLALITRNAAKMPDRERGLDELLGKIPGAPLESPVLQIEPTHKDFGIVSVGDERRFDLTMTNKKDRLLYGKASIDNCPWLVLGEAGTSSKLFQFFGNMSLPVRIQGDRLRAYSKPQKAEIVIESNGGNATIVVQVMVPVKPFAEGVLSGAASPRQLAEKAKAHTKEAAELLENGAVSRWYAANGWTYPVTGPTATGIAAVQQLFETLGYVKIPKVELSEPAITLRGKPGDRLEYVLTVMAQEKRPALGFAVSDQPWLTVGQSAFRGQSASIPLTVQAVPPQPNAKLQATVKVTANGGKRFDVPVTLHVGDGPITRSSAHNGVPVLDPVEDSVQTLTPQMLAGEAPMPVPAPPPPPPPPDPAFTPPVLPPSVPAPAPTAAIPAPVPVAVAAVAVGAAAVPAAAQPVAAPPGRRVAGPWLMRLLPLGIIAFGLLIAVARDLIPREAAEEPLPEIDYDHPVLDIKFHDARQEPEYVTVPSMRFGIGIPDPKDSRNFRTKLTYDDYGRTNNVCVRVDDVDFLWGVEGGAWKPGTNVKQELGNDPQGHRQIGARADFVRAGVPIIVTQWVKLVPGGLSPDGKKRLLDTCLIRYDITNDDGKPHKIGLRFLLDTLIGSNDGVPFTISGTKELCNTSKELNRDDVPDYISALEREDLKDPGTVAHISLKYAEGIEVPTRVTLGAWPANKVREFTGNPDAKRQDTRWNVPVAPMAVAKSDDPKSPNARGDSAVVLYWDDKEMPAKTTRTVGFAYGLGTVTGEKGAGQLGLTASVGPVKGKEFTLTAYVQNPAKDARATLTLPRGMTLTSGKETEDVPQPGTASSYSTVTWHVKTDKSGIFPVKVSLNSGARVVQKVVVQQEAENIR